jgi:hypothetical protein
MTRPACPICSMCKIDGTPMALEAMFVNKA